MKDFMLIFIGGNPSEADYSPEELQNQIGKWWAWQQKMEEAGILKGGHALHNHMRQVSGPERTVTDRTGTELKELIGGYYVVSAKDYDAAIEIAQDYPNYEFGGTVEIREIQHFQQ